VRLGEVIDQDMITVPVSERLRLIVVGAPEYFARHPAPAHPRDLPTHECLNWRPGSDRSAYAWEFTENGHDFAVAFEAPVLTNDPALNLRLARRRGPGPGALVLRRSRSCCNRSNSAAHSPASRAAHVPTRLAAGSQHAEGRLRRCSES
jgi:DNA-binding transcriptional LysR family regulator